jgi:hypothetical protein
MVTLHKDETMKRITDPKTDEAELRSICLRLMRIVYPEAVTRHRVQQNEIIPDGHE